MKAIILTPDEFEDLIQKGALAALNSFLSCNPALRPQPVKVEPPDSLLTVKDVQRELKVSRVTVNNWIRSGELQCKRIGKRVFFSRAEILRMPKKGGRS